MVNIVCSHHFKMTVDPKTSVCGGIAEYELDLGRSYTKQNEKGHLVSNIKDTFILDFMSENYGMVYKVGIMGSITLYTYSLLPKDEIWIYYKGEKNVFKYDANRVELNVKKYLGEMLKNL